MAYLTWQRDSLGHREFCRSVLHIALVTIAAPWAVGRDGELAAQGVGSTLDLHSWKSLDPLSDLAGIPLDIHGLWVIASHKASQDSLCLSTAILRSMAGDQGVYGGGF